VWTGFIWLRIGTSGSSCEHENKTSGPIRCGEFPNWAYCQLVKMNPAPCSLLATLSRCVHLRKLELCMGYHTSAVIHFLTKCVIVDKFSSDFIICAKLNTCPLEVFLEVSWSFFFGFRILKKCEKCESE
jgi:hypothetical protein